MPRNIIAILQIHLIYFKNDSHLRKTLQIRKNHFADILEKLWTIGLKTHTDHEQLLLGLKVNLLRLNSWNLNNNYPIRQIIFFTLILKSIVMHSAKIDIVNFTCPNWIINVNHVWFLTPCIWIHICSYISIILSTTRLINIVYRKRTMKLKQTKHWWAPRATLKPNGNRCFWWIYILMIKYEQFPYTKKSNTKIYINLYRMIESIMIYSCGYEPKEHITVRIIFNG